jgi:hypothetical protein
MHIYIHKYIHIHAIRAWALQTEVARLPIIVLQIETILRGSYCFVRYECSRACPNVCCWHKYLIEVYVLEYHSDKGSAEHFMCNSICVQCRPSEQ